VRYRILFDLPNRKKTLLTIQSVQLTWHGRTYDVAYFDKEGVDWEKMTWLEFSWQDTRSNHLLTRGTFLANWMVPCGTVIRKTWKTSWKSPPNSHAIHEFLNTIFVTYYLNFHIGTFGAGSGLGLRSSPR
jgi:hypothetical protein